ncbi:Galactokinase [Linderina pennispora]|uniref:Galactokinase n=1 Tax=Linderina pennispora TaxID=61395 RepID=A0A1Y1WD05_9FUNG|nr:Galactokinase [Linderina pennispora]ORX71427.1 Galactokinase [Linderina pennispora]
MDAWPPKQYKTAMRRTVFWTRTTTIIIISNTHPCQRSLTNSPMSSPAPVIKSLNDIYSLNSKPDFIARAPGRVNIIGEHIDYCGFPVFPMAIAPDTLIAVRANNTDRVHVANTLNDKYPARLFSATSDIFEIDSTVHEWSNYFKCGYRGLFDRLGHRNGKGMDALMDGTVPAGSGLSSSAAFVCATLLAVQRVCGISLTQSELVSIAASAERHVGFHPKLRGTPVKFPETDPSMVFVIANTLVVADKHVSAPVCYNLRVVETRVGALILAKHLGLASRPACKDVDPLVFKIIMDELFADQDTAGRDEVQVWIERLPFAAHPDGYTREEMAAALDMTPAELSTKIHEDQFPVRADRFQILQRACHAFSETLRVVKFRQACESSVGDVAKILGSLMNQSQDSCRDLFNCSCPELDELCSIARSAGSLGSRLTGAGWGGCSVHMVPQNKVEDVKDALAEQYYAKKFPQLTKTQLDDALFAYRPWMRKSPTLVYFQCQPSPSSNSP